MQNAAAAIDLEHLREWVGRVRIETSPGCGTRD